MFLCKKNKRKYYKYLLVKTIKTSGKRIIGFVGRVNRN